MCKVCESAGAVQQAANALTAACVDHVSLATEDDGSIGPRLRFAHKVDPQTPPDFTELLARLDQAKRG